MMHLVGSTSTLCVSEVMADCATHGLQDLPAPAFKVVLSQLSSQDHGSLRSVNRPLLQLTCDQLPYLVLRLSESSDAQHMQQCCQATKSLKHVSSIHVVIAGEVPQHVLGSAMQLLSERPKIKELQLLAAYGNLSSDSTTPFSGCNNVYVPSRIVSLQPLASLLTGGLQSLVIKGVAIKELSEGLKQLTAAATTENTGTARGWQLQNLTLQPAWSYSLDYLVLGPSWTDFPDAMMHITKTFPHLQHLEVCLPQLKLFRSTTADQFPCDCDGRQLANITAIAALGNAALQLKALQVLTVTNAPDIWERFHYPDICPATATAQQAQLVADVLASGKISTLSAATQAFSTLDEYGCWLLQHHSVLKELHISTAQTGWGMSWKQQQRRSTDDGVAATAMTPVDVKMRCPGPQLVMQAVSNRVRSLGSSSTGSSSNSNSHCGRAQELARVSTEGDRTLSRYSSRSADLLMQLTTSCFLVIYTDERYLQPLWTLSLGQCFRNLKHLQVEINYTHVYSNDSAVQLASSPGRSAAAVTAAAAAAVPSLESLTLICNGQTKWLHDDLLLPLAAAASSSSIRKLQLQLVGNITGVAASTWTSVDVTAAVEAVRGLDGYNTCWQHALRQLHGLHGLTISNTCHSEQLTILVDHLPRSLRVFSGSGLNISSLEASAVAASLASGAVAAQPASSMATAAAKGACNAWSEADTATPNLVKLDLDRCVLSDPNILASTQLQQLTVSDSSWPGGWTAAATAWPEVRDLMWRYDDRSALLTSPAPRTTSGDCCTTSTTSGGHSMSYCSSDSSLDCATRSEVADALATLAAARKDVATFLSTVRDHRKVLTQVMSGHVTEKLPITAALQDISGGFRNLRSFTLTQLSWLSVEVLQPVLQQFGEIRNLHLGFLNLLLSAIHTYGGRLPYFGINNSTGMKSHLILLQQWLQQQLPWASVCVYSEYI